MHDIEPYYKWKPYYDSTQDKRSPYYGKEHSEFEFTHQIYNYLIHPQWDDFGSPTLYLKILFVDYSQSIMMVELIGEWNDALNNDIMLLRKHIIDPMIELGVDKFVLLCDNVLNFHGSDNSYYEDWFHDTDEGWICLLNTLDHVIEEMEETGIHYYIKMGALFNDILWQKYNPLQLLELVENKIDQHYNATLI